MQVDEPEPSTSSSPRMVQNCSKQPQSNVMANSSIVPSVTVSLHPLVIMNISEHWTRRRAQEGKILQGNWL